MKKRSLRVLCAILGCVLLFAAVGTVFYHGEWWFPILERIRVYSGLALTRVNQPGEMHHYTLATLAAMEGITFTETMMLVNPTHPLPKDYVAQLTEYRGAKMNPLMVDSYVALRDDVEAATGVRIYVASDYRTFKEQSELYEQSGNEIAAEPGYSEHETGLALDVYAPYFAGENFLRSRAGRMVNRICGEYGFILRYPVGGKDTTGFAYEPWHLRYVGAPHAELIMNSGFTYEEYIRSFKLNAWYATEDGEYLIARCEADRLELPEGWVSGEISPDNTGCYLITLKMK